MYLKYLQTEKMMEKTLKKDNKFGVKDDQTKLKKRRKFGGQMHKNVGNS